MKNRIDRILLGLLWLLASTLGICFWFNTAFGFNIFSTQHWQYLAYMQAAHQPVKPMFYASIAASVFIMIFGLYMLVRPRFRKITLAVRDTSNKEKQISPAAPTVTAAQTASTLDITPAPATAQAPQPASPRPATPQNIKRPPHLTLPRANNYQAAPSARTESTFAPTSAPDPEKYKTELREIFESAGYVSKNAPKIGNVRTALLAIGTNEVLWLGAVGVSTTDMRRAIDRLDQVFSDTLDDITISINGFVIQAPDAATSEFQDILMFASANEVREYIAAHPNPPLPDDDQGNFDAYSAYISTVADYVGKI